MNTSTYADFLLSLIKLIEKEQAYAIVNDIHRLCYLCNILDNPRIPNAEEWKRDNAVYITMMQNAIIAKMKRYNKAEEKKAAYIKSQYPFSANTLSIPLREQYFPHEDAYTIRLLWLHDLYKFHKARGTTRHHRERRGLLKLPAYVK